MAYSKGRIAVSWLMIRTFSYLFYKYSKTRNAFDLIYSSRPERIQNPTPYHENSRTSSWFCRVPVPTGTVLPVPVLYYRYRYCTTGTGTYRYRYLPVLYYRYRYRYLPVLYYRYRYLPELYYRYRYLLYYRYHTIVINHKIISNATFVLKQDTKKGYIDCFSVTGIYILRYCKSKILIQIFDAWLKNS
jgi:hypothetical protein